MQHDTTPSILYALSSFTYLFAILSSNYALKFVSYPMQVKLIKFRIFTLIEILLFFKVLGKSIKPIPIMLIGAVVGRKHYPLEKYFYVLLIVFGMKNSLMSEEHSFL